MLILSPRAVERLLTYTPPWPLPKLFRMTSGGKLIEGIFEGGDHQLRPRCFCVEDYIDALNWGKSLGGLDALIARADANTKALADWVAKTPWVDFLAKDATTRSNTSVSLEVVDPAITELAPDAQASFCEITREPARKRKKSPLMSGAYRDAPPGLRIWCGATVDTKDIEALTPWLDFAYAIATGRSRQSMTFPEGPRLGPHLATTTIAWLNPSRHNVRKRPHLC